MGVRREHTEENAWGEGPRHLFPWTMPWDQDVPSWRCASVAFRKCNSPQYKRKHKFSTSWPKTVLFIQVHDHWHRVTCTGSKQIDRNSEWATHWNKTSKQKITQVAKEESTALGRFSTALVCECKAAPITKIADSQICPWICSKSQWQVTKWCTCYRVGNWGTSKKERTCFLDL